MLFFVYTNDSLSLGTMIDHFYLLFTLDWRKMPRQAKIPFLRSLREQGFGGRREYPVIVCSFSFRKCKVSGNNVRGGTFDLSPKPISQKATLSYWFVNYSHKLVRPPSGKTPYYQIQRVNELVPTPTCFSLLILVVKTLSRHVTDFGRGLSGVMPSSV